MGLFSRKPKCFNVVSPASGELVPCSTIKDPTFGESLMGVTAAVKPTNGTIVAPIDGKIALLFPTGHAFAIENTHGNQILVHIGMETVGLNPGAKPGDKLKGFEVLAKQGDIVKAGTPIIKANLKFIKSKKLDITTPFVLLSETANGFKFEFEKTNKKVKAGDVIGTICK